MKTICFRRVGAGVAARIHSPATLHQHTFGTDVRDGRSPSRRDVFRPVLGGAAQHPLQYGQHLGVLGRRYLHRVPATSDVVVAATTTTKAAA